MIVDIPEIRGNSWELKHNNGVGTYAKFHDIDWQVIEEYAAPENRLIWDSMNEQELIDTCYASIVNSMFVEVDGNEDSEFGLMFGDEETHIYLHIDVRNTPIICYVNNIPCWNIEGVIDFKLPDCTDATEIRGLLESEEFKEYAEALYEDMFNESIMEGIEYFLNNNVVEYDGYEV